MSTGNAYGPDALARPLVVAPGRISWEKYELPPEPAPGKVRLRAVSSLISPGSELSLFEGHPMVDGLNSAFSPDAEALVMASNTKQGSDRVFPVSVGYNLAAEIVAVGHGVSPRRLGTLVFALARHQPVSDVADWEAIPLSEGTDTRLAPLLYLPTLGLSAFRRVGYQSGQTVGVIGLGLVGLSAALVAEALGAEPICFEASPLRRDFARSLLSHSRVQEAPTWSDWTDQIDVVVEAAGRREALELAAEVASFGGVIAALGLHGEDLGTLFSRNFYRKSLQLMFCTNDAYQTPGAAKHTIASNVAEIARLHQSGRLHLAGLANTDVGAHHIDQAFELLARRDTTRGVIVDWVSPDRPISSTFNLPAAGRT